jgi:hypothetical protein
LKRLALFWVSSPRRIHPKLPAGLSSQSSTSPPGGFDDDSFRQSRARENAEKQNDKNTHDSLRIVAGLP